MSLYIVSYTGTFSIMDEILPSLPKKVLKLSFLRSSRYIQIVLEYLLPIIKLNQTNSLAVFYNQGKSQQ